MADLAKNLSTLQYRKPGLLHGPMADGITLFHGMLVGIESGYLNHWADGANDVFAGILILGDDRAWDGVLTGETSDTLVPQASVDTSGLILEHLASLGGTPTQAKVGDYVYSATSNPDDLTLDNTSRNHPVGFLCYYRSATDCDVQLFSIGEHLAQVLA
jgi:hypothetical protein